MNAVTAEPSVKVIKRLVVDEHNDIFDAADMTYVSYPSLLSDVRAYAYEIVRHAPEAFREEGLLEQQISEIIKNGVKHGNHCDPAKNVHIWYSFHKRAKIIVEDEGEGFTAIEEWNDYFRKRQEALFSEDFDTFLALAAYRGAKSDANDGGNSLIAALEYWNGGIIYSARKNKVGVVRWYTNGSVYV